MPTVIEILNHKQGEVYQTTEDTTILEATQIMNHNQIGSLVVMQDNHVAGMFTERDVLRRVVAEGVDPIIATVGEVMTCKVICCRPNQLLEETRILMKERHIRHVPVVDTQGALVGLISIGDLNAWSLRDGKGRIQQMEEYIYGRV